MDVYIPITEARNNFPKLVDNVNETMDRVVITKKGRTKAVLLSVDEYEDIIETLEILSNPKTLAKLKRSKKQAREGQYKTLEEVEKELGLK